MITQKNTIQYTQLIKSRVSELGFEYCGIAKAGFLEDDARRLEQWLSKDYHGKMAYMADHFELRTDPTRLVPGAKSVITLLYNYYPEQQAETDIKVSKYAYGEDYHEIIRPKLRSLLQYISEHIGQVNGRGFVDSAPVLERAWAQKSGLGWIGKNAHLIHKQTGSFFFIATLIIDLELQYDDPYAKDYCGTCTRCIDACPTDAIVAPTVIDGSRCISYLTIELKDELMPQQFKGKLDNWIFGCDVCQDVCPWNSFASPQSKEELRPNPALLQFDIKDWLQLEEDTFKTLFRNSPIKRAKWKGLKRNVQFIHSGQRND
ncbi:MAG: tRNA epoxyqueuosine(34) reductase QueG [Taibaiella sp.]|nr:tRNA epoxyqueuosine(34) reductase QueG [Taibaiella sp.]